MTQHRTFPRLDMPSDIGRVGSLSGLRPAKTPKADRGSIDFAFEKAAGNGDVTEREREAAESLMNQEGQTLHAFHNIHGEVRDQLDRMRVLLPVYNQQETIGQTLDYVVGDLGIPPEHVIASSNSNDGSDAIIEQYGVEIVSPEAVLEQYIADKDRFLELLKANSWKDLRGKGLNMFAGHLQRFMREQMSPHDFVVQVDTDIENIGGYGDNWDPITYFAWALQRQGDIEGIKAAKNGRNNQPIHIYLNALGSLSPEGAHYQQKIGVERWPLTGEYGWRGDVSSRLRWASGYAVEMVLNMSQADLDIKKRQVEIPEGRIDGKNPLTKETVMYSDILNTVQSVAMRGRLNELTVSDIAAINEAAQGRYTYVAEEADTNPGPSASPNTVHKVQPSRIIPDFNTLKEKGYLYLGN